jgi:hypothetical protein
MKNQKLPFIVLSTIVSVLFFSALANPLPVLDEEGYLLIAEQMRYARPYDWQLPWPPFEEENAFIYAHPPLFLWLVTALWSMEISLDMMQWVLAIPWQIMLCASVAWLSVERLQKPWPAMLLWMSMAGVALPSVRSLMPDLQVSALATLSMVIWLCAPRKLGWMLIGGILLGLAAWTKYPALLLILVPMIHPKGKAETSVYVIGALGIVGLGELWLYSLYDAVHLIEVIKRAPEIARGPLESRLVGIMNRVPLSAFGVVFLMLVVPRKMKYLLFGVCASVGMYIAQKSGVEQVYWAGLLAAIGGQIIRVMIGKTELHTWAWLVFFGVLFAHNYASPRYWLLAMAPMTILVVQQVWQRGVKVLAIIGSMSISLTLSHAEQLHAQESQRLAQEAYRDFPGTHYSGEWTYRWEMKRLGATHIQNDQPKVVLVAQESVGGLMYPERYQLQRSYRGIPHKIHLVSVPNSVGYYADTIGYWPILWRDSAIEEVQVWKRK